MAKDAVVNVQFVEDVPPQYEMVFGDDAQSLVRRINDLARDGWRPLFAPTFYPPLRDAEAWFCLVVRHGKVPA